MSLVSPPNKEQYVKCNEPGCTWRSTSESDLCITAFTDRHGRYESHPNASLFNADGKFLSKLKAN